MPLLRDAITWEGLKIGSDHEADAYFDDSIDGWGQPPYSMPSTPRQMGGEWGGQWSVQAATYTTNVWMDVGEGTARNLAAYRALRSSMKLRPNPNDEVALAWSGLLWDDEVCAFVRPTRCVPVVDEDAVHGGKVGLDLQWLSTDAVVYSYEAEQRLWPTDDPVTGDSFTVGNTGDLVPWARRAIKWRFTAHGSVTGLTFRIDHPDGTFEEIVVQGTIPSGHVLTVGDDMTARIQSEIVTSRIRSNTNLFTGGRAPRWPLLHPDDGEDEANEVTVSVDTGAVSGYCETRSTQ
jgi:hypothetical protein